jgi:flagellar hook-length control protein FliK
MSSIPSSDPQGAPTASPLQGLLGLLQGRRPDESVLFEREMDRAVERRGGEAAVEERRASLDHERRASRRAGFERYRERTAGARRRPADEPATDAAPDAAPVAAPVATDARPAAPAPEEGAGTSRAPRAGENAAGRSGSGPRTRAEQAPPAAAPSVGASPAPPAAAATGTGKETQAVGAKASATAARPANPTAAFVAGARGETRAQTAKPAAPPPPAATPDTELIDHANEVLRQIRLRLSAGGREVSVQLSPAELGRLSIRMQVKDGRLSTLVRAESPETLELLERQAPELRALLAEQGFETERLDLELGPDGRDRGAARDDARNPERATRTTSDAAAQQNNDHPTPVLAREGGVDTFA